MVMSVPTFSIFPFVLRPRLAHSLALSMCCRWPPLPLLLYDTYQHGCTQVKLLLELCDEDVHLHQLFLITCLHLTDDVRQPLEALLSPRDPQEVHLV